VLPIIIFLYKIINQNPIDNSMLNVFQVVTTGTISILLLTIISIDIIKKQIINCYLLDISYRQL